MMIHVSNIFAQVLTESVTSKQLMGYVLVGFKVLMMILTG